MAGIVGGGVSPAARAARAARSAAGSATRNSAPAPFTSTAAAARAGQAPPVPYVSVAAARAAGDPRVAAQRNPDIQTTLPSRRVSCPLHIAAFPAAPWMDGKKYQYGTLKALITQNAPQRKVNWVYQFLFNPLALQLQTNINNELTTDIMFDKIGLISGQQTLAFTVGIDRMLEVNKVPSTGQMQHPDLALVQRIGTLYDINYIYRVINGDDHTTDYNTAIRNADYGFLFNTMIELQFGPAFRFTGFITNLGVNHKLFSRDMVPTFSEVSFAVTRLSSQELPTSTTTPPEAGAPAAPVSPRAVEGRGTATTARPQTATEKAKAKALAEKLKRLERV